MSIVDTWGWDKLDTSTYDEPIKMTADMKVQTIMRDFYEHYNIYPNKIIMGYRLVDKLRREFFGTVGAVRTFEEVMAVINSDVKCEYEGIPVDIDYNNPDKLEVGYMVKWVENKYE